MNIMFHQLAVTDVYTEKRFVMVRGGAMVEGLTDGKIYRHEKYGREFSVILFEIAIDGESLFDDEENNRTFIDFGELGDMGGMLDLQVTSCYKWHCDADVFVKYPQVISMTPQKLLTIRRGSDDIVVIHGDDSLLYVGDPATEKPIYLAENDTYTVAKGVM